MKELKGLTREDAKAITLFIQAMVPDVFIHARNDRGTRYLSVIHDSLDLNYSVANAAQAAEAIELFRNAEKEVNDE